MRWIIQLSPSVWKIAYFPCTRSPAKVTITSSSRNFSVSYVPRSQIAIVPAPYSPFGIFPSNSRYSSGWSSVRTASRFSFGSCGTPFGSAQDARAPSRSSRRSQCSRRAWCSWTTNRSPLARFGFFPLRGSGVFSNDRFPSYSVSFLDATCDRILGIW